MTKLSPYLTPAGARVLRWMIDEGEELVVEGVSAYVGLHRTSSRVAIKLLEWCLIRRVEMNGVSATYYKVTSDAAQCLANPDYEPRWAEALRTGKSVYR